MEVPPRFSPVDPSKDPQGFPNGIPQVISLAYALIYIIQPFWTHHILCYGKLLSDFPQTCEGFTAMLCCTCLSEKTLGGYYANRSICQQATMVNNQDSHLFKPLDHAQKSSRFSHFCSTARMETLKNWVVPRTFPRNSFW